MMKRHRQWYKCIRFLLGAGHEFRTVRRTDGSWTVYLNDRAYHELLSYIYGNRGVLKGLKVSNFGVDDSI